MHSASVTKKFSFLKAGLVVILLGASTAIPLPAQTLPFKSIASFNGINGSGPGTGALVLGSDGSFYGTTFVGGSANSGEVFKVTPSGRVTVLYSFCGQPARADGKYPIAGLLLASDGNFYGTTEEGGTYNCGTVFKISPSGVLTTLHSFQGPPDGFLPVAGVAQGTDGNFYGITQWGGAYCNDGGCGSVFKVTPAGETTILHSFTGGVDGRYPAASVVLGRDGNLYGTTFEGGSFGGGTIFNITSAGTLTTLYGFCAQFGCVDGNGPAAALLQASDGNFYGTTRGGGTGWGNVFRFTPANNSVTNLYSFCPQFACGDGEDPLGALIQDREGNFYGTASVGGAYNYYGTVFKITPEGMLTTLHSFNGNDGNGPWSGLLQAPDGFLYGTTVAGGVSVRVNQSNGTIFRLGSASCGTCGP